MLAVKEVIELVKEFKAEEKKAHYEIFYKDGKGSKFDRAYRKKVYSARYDELKELLQSEKACVFKCAECGEMCGYFELEHWVCDFEKSEYVCSACYENSMGDDL